MRVLITGAAGFVGHHLVEHLLKKTDWELALVDKLSYASTGLNRLRAVQAFEQKRNRVHLFTADVSLPLGQWLEREIGSIDYIVHMAAESIPEEVYVPVRSIRSSFGTKMLTFGELWETVSDKRIETSRRVQIKRLEKNELKALSFYGGVGQWMSIRAITRHRYSGEIVRLSQKTGIISATPNHSIYAANLDVVNPKDNPWLLKVSSVNGLRVSKHKEISDEKLIVLAAYITEGSSGKYNGSYCVQIGQKKKEYLTRVQKALKEAYGVNSWITYNKHDGCWNLQLSSKKIYRKLRRQCGENSGTKKFPNAIFDLSPDKQRFFLEELKKGDGDVKGDRYFTTSWKLANQLGFLLALLGIPFVVNPNEGKLVEGWADDWTIRMNAPTSVGRGERRMYSTYYDGWVYDLEVEESHNFACGLGNIVCHNTHVDNSIEDPAAFVRSNVIGTMEVLQFARRLQSRLKRFVYFSTDEVFGPAPKGVEFEEWARYNSTNPYSATKAAGEELALAWANTYKLPVIVTHCMNCFGERQHPEKFVPSTVKKILGGQLITVHADPSKTQPGSRHYIHCRNVADALCFLLEKHQVPDGMPVRDKFNIRGEQEVDNLELVRRVHKIMEEAMGTTFELRTELVDFHGTRPGHDLRYALSGKKLEEMGWKPPADFDESLEKTIRWMVDQRNIHWLFM